MNLGSRPEAHGVATQGEIRAPAGTGDRRQEGRAPIPAMGFLGETTGGLRDRLADRPGSHPCHRFLARPPLWHHGPGRAAPS